MECQDRTLLLDCVVIGGGTAGQAIAYRLAEDETNSIAVIEAGNFYTVENGITSVPAYNQEYNCITPTRNGMYHSSTRAT